jgi:hypothetical protein
MERHIAEQEMNEMSFPAVQEGDKASHGGYTFTYTSGKWIAD